MLRRLAGAAAALLLLAMAAWLPARDRAGLPSGPSQATAGTLRLAAAPFPAEAAPPGGAAAPAGAAASPAAALARPSLPAPQDVPLRADGPVQAVRNFFFILGPAANLPETPAGEVPGAGTAPYATAFEYLDPAWQGRLGLEGFTAEWKGVAHLDLLQALDAGPVPGEPRARRVWVEVRLWQVLGDQQVIGFRDGVYQAQATRAGWKLTGGSLQPEAIISRAFGATPAWRSDPGAVAAAYVTAATRAAPSVLAVQSRGDTATARLQPAGTRQTWSVHLARRVDGTWVALYSSRG